MRKIYLTSVIMKMRVLLICHSQFIKKLMAIITNYLVVFIVLKAGFTGDGVGVES